MKPRTLLREEAEERQKEREKLLAIKEGIQKILANLDKKYGKGKGAQKERARLNDLLLK